MSKDIKEPEAALQAYSERRAAHMLALKQHLEAGRKTAAAALMFHTAGVEETATPREKYAYHDLTDALAHFAESHPEAKIVLIRHGQTEYTKLGKITGGGTNIPLNEAGIAETRAIAASPVGDAVRKLNENAVVYCSDLTRAQQTKDIFLGPDATVRTDHRVAERRLGSKIEGTADGPARKILNKVRHDEPDGEGSYVYAARVEKMMVTLLKEAADQGKDLLIFSHSNWIGTALAELMQTAGKAQGWNGKVPTGQPIVLQSNAEGVFSSVPLTVSDIKTGAAAHPDAQTDMASHRAPSQPRPA